MRKRFLTIAIILMILVTGGSCGQSLSPAPSPAPIPESTPKPPQSPTTATSTPSSVPYPTSPTSPTLPPEVEKGLLILSYSSYIDIQGYFRVVGEVENIGNNNYEKNKVTVTFYDEQGIPELTQAGDCYLDIMKPGDKSPFEIVLPEVPKLENYRLAAEWQVTNKPPNNTMEVREVEVKTDSEGYYVITGQVTNTSEKLIDTTMVIGSFYDSKGSIVAAGIAFADIVPLKPHETADFIMAIDPHISSKISSHSLQAVVYD